MKEVVIVGAKRSAIGAFGKSLLDVSAREIGAQVVRAMLSEIHISADQVGKVILGNVLSAGLGQNIARQIALDAGISEDCPAMTINQVCGSGLQSVILATQSIQVGETQLVVCGGVENMSQAPYVSPNLRWGSKLGHSSMCDTLVHDGLWDAFNDYHMGVTAENIAKEWNISRERQDEFALESQKKAGIAQEAGKFKDEIVPILIPQRKGDPIVFESDEYIRRDTSLEKLSVLKPAFDKEGTVTAGNASGINDGGSIIILAEKSYAQANNLPILACIEDYNTTGLSPKIMGYGPAKSIKALLSQVNCDIKQIDRFELNEAFAAQSIAVIDDLKLDKEKVNMNGGAIALGHPIGASGARILTTLIHGMIKEGDGKGIASLCVGGGMGVSVLISR